jgi:hypothetical protein
MTAADRDAGRPSTDGHAPRAAEDRFLTARRDDEIRTQTLTSEDAQSEARRLRADGWRVTIRASRKEADAERAKKQLAAVIAAHRRDRRARRDADDAAASGPGAGD